MRLIQFEIPESGRRVGKLVENEVYDLTSVRPAWLRVIDIFLTSQESGRTVSKALDDQSCDRFGYSELLDAEPQGGHPWVCSPVDHADEHRVLVSGTGLTHTGGMKSRVPIGACGFESRLGY